MRDGGSVSNARYAARNAESPERRHIAGLDHPNRVSRQNAGAPVPSAFGTRAAPRPSARVGRDGPPALTAQALRINSVMLRARVCRHARIQASSLSGPPRGKLRQERYVYSRRARGAVR